MRTRRSPRARRAPIYTALVAVAALSATALPAPAGAAIATKSLSMSQTFEFNGQKWRQTITASDSTSDSISFSFAKVYKKTKAGKLVYNLRESQMWTFSGLDANTVQIASDLTVKINTGSQYDHLLDADIDLNAVAGEGIDKSCNGNIKRRIVQKSGASTLALNTSNDVFGTVRTIPKRATVTTSNGKCAGSGGGGALACPTDGEKGVSGSGFTTGAPSLFWNGSVAGTSSTIGATTTRQVQSGVNYLASLSGKAEKSRVVVANDLTKGSLEGQGLPRLSGKATVSDAGSPSQGSWTNCGKGLEYRQLSKSGTQGGNLVFTPSGGTGVSVDSAWSFESASTSKQEVRRR